MASEAPEAPEAAEVVEAEGDASDARPQAKAGPELTPEQEEALKKIQAAQRGLEQRAADVDATATATMAEGAGDAGAVPGVPAPAANGSARVATRRQKRWNLRKARMYRLAYDFQIKKLIEEKSSA
ncbi:unnamed protein product [Cladocopium goreaui]|uniref:Uncharacterized protein n=1 Tax=Cladocopium goreaui TaxID=2562237 RepID=A0A9P1DMZ0_9DINO|nr:unnamed protein product [Cladocopium goreaui]